MSYKKIELTSREAKSYFSNDLVWPNSISSRMDRHDLDRGKLFTYVPHSMDKPPSEFDRGYNYDLGLNEQKITDFLASFLAKGPNNIIVVEHPYASPTDPFLKKYRGDWMSHEETVFNLIRSPSDLESHFDFGKFYKAYLSRCSDGFKYLRAGILENEECDYFAKYCEYIVVSVFDDEGFMVWSHIASDSSII